MLSINKTKLNILEIKANSYNTLVFESDFTSIFILAAPLRSVQGRHSQLHLTDENLRSLLTEQRPNPGFQALNQRNFYNTCTILYHLAILYNFPLLTLQY